ncbi:MAG: hypothetical protein CMF29_07195 [Kiritimatiellaceae bacterium]|nr:hypothetical protein [Kiritimatiellaceae bacterium]
MKLLTIFLLLSMTCCIANAEKKNPPKNDDIIEAALIEAGKDHFPPDFKFDEIGTIKHEDTYYHAFVGYLKTGNYRVLLFDNTPTYLGFYTVEYEPVDYEESAVLLDDGADGYFNLRIGKEGPLENILVDGLKTSFVTNDQAPAEKQSMEEEKPKITIAYRDWTFSVKGQSRSARAIFVKKLGSKVYLKDEKRGITKDFPFGMLSKEDIDYLRSIDAL